MILQNHVDTREQVLANDVTLDEIASRSVGYTPRMLVNLINEAGIQAGRRIFGKFSDVSIGISDKLEVTAQDYVKADSYLRPRSDLNFLRRRDDEILRFVEKHNRGRMGF